MPRVGTALEYGLGDAQTAAAPAALLSPSVNPDAFGAGQAQDLGNAAQGIMAFSQAAANQADREAALEERDAHAQAVSMGTAAQAWAADRFRYYQDNAQPGAPGMADAVTKDFDEYAATQLKYAPDRVKEIVKADFDRIRLSLREDAANFQRGAAHDKATTDLEASLDVATQALVTDPSKFQDTLTRWAQIINNADGLSQQQKIEKLAAVTTSLQVATLQGMIQKDPEGALGLLKSNEQLLGLNGQQRLQLTNQAEQEVARLQAERRAQRAELLQGVGEKVRFATEMISRGLKVDGIDDIRRQARGTPYQDVLQSAEGAADAARLHAMKPLQDQVAEIQKLRDQPQTPESFQKLQALQQATAGAAEAIKNGTELQYMADLGMFKLEPVNVTDPASLAKRRTQVLMTEQHFGNPVSMLTQEERAAAIADLSSLPPEQQLNRLAQMQTAAGKDFPSLLGELNAGPGGLPRVTRTLLMVAGRPEAAPIVGALIEGINSKEEDLNVILKQTGARPADLDRQVQTELQKFDESIGTTYRLGSGGASGTASALIADVHDAVIRTAKVLMRTMDMQSAVKMAADLIVNTRYTYVDGYRVPKALWPDASKFTDALKFQLSLLKPTDLQVPPAMRDLPPDRAAQVYHDDIVNGGRWITLPDESGVMLVDGDGNAVLYADGRPVIMTFETPTAPPQQPAAPQAPSMLGPR